MNRHFHTTMT